MVTLRSGRAGAALAEALVALVVGLLVVQLGLSTLARLRRAQGELAARADGLVALRVGRHVLRRELRHGVPARDWIVDGDSLALRAFRGTGTVCMLDAAAAEIVVAYVGERAPDPTKDSVLVVTSDGGSSVHALTGVGASSGCPGPVGSTPARWRLDRPVPGGAVVARLFERGSYHLSAAALRYRRGASGRQPLTPETWAATSRFVVTTERLGVTLVPSRSPGAAWTGWIASRVPE